MKRRKLKKQSLISNTFNKRSKSKYSPHQGEQEKARRKRQIEKGILKI